MEIPLPVTSRAPYGARGLKYQGVNSLGFAFGRAPYGARGLKLLTMGILLIGGAVAPRMGRVD